MFTMLGNLWSLLSVFIKSLEGFGIAMHSLSGIAQEAAQEMHDDARAKRLIRSNAIKREILASEQLTIDQ